MRISPCGRIVVSALRADVDRPLCGADLRQMYPELHPHVVYPLLRRWERWGYVVSQMEDLESKGLGRALRRYYTLTDLGLAEYDRLVGLGRLRQEDLLDAQRRAENVRIGGDASRGAVLVIEGVVEVDVEDGGRAKILHVDDGDSDEEGVFVRVQSWSEAGDHAALDPLVGQRLRVTVEVVPARP